jgi:putative ABC transport system substrate-binding protein
MTQLIQNEGTRLQFGGKAGNLPTIRFMGTSTPGAWAEWVAPFRGRLRELGWMEGRNINIEFRWAESRNKRFTDIAAEFTHLNVDVIVTSRADGGPVSTAACRRAAT